MHSLIAYLACHLLSLHSACVYLLKKYHHFHNYEPVTNIQMKISNEYLSGIHKIFLISSMQHLIPNPTLVLSPLGLLTELLRTCDACLRVCSLAFFSNSCLLRRYSCAYQKGEVLWKYYEYEVKKNVKLSKAERTLQINLQYYPSRDHLDLGIQVMIE